MKINHNNQIDIIFPCYRNETYLINAIDALIASTEKKFNIILINDAGPINLNNIISRYASLPILYKSNPVNLGAINNMISCIFFNGPAKYTLCHHDDDLLHKDFLKIAQEILENDPNLAFVATQSLSFKNIDDIVPQEYPNTETIKMNKSEMICYFANNDHLAFGSVVYRKKYLSKKCIDLKKYAMLFDRPFLAELLSNNLQGAIIKAPLYFYRHHSYPDNRWKGLTIKNIHNLYKYYKQEKKAKILSRYFFDFANLDNKTFQDYLYFISSLSKLHLKITPPSAKALKFILAGFFVLLFGKKNYQQIFEKIKNLK